MLAGALGSLGLTLRAGRHNHSLILMMMFGVWVVSPFMGMAVAYILSNRWPVLTRNVLYLLSLALTFISLLIYGGFWSPPGIKPAFDFLVLPLISWLTLAVVIPLTASSQKK